MLSFCTTRPCRCSVPRRLGVIGARLGRAKAICSCSTPARGPANCRRNSGCKSKRGCRAAPRSGTPGVAAWLPADQKLQHGELRTLDVGDGRDDHLLGVDLRIVVGQQAGSQRAAERPQLVLPGGSRGGVQSEPGQQLRALRGVDPLVKLVFGNAAVDGGQRARRSGAAVRLPIAPPRLPLTSGSSIGPSPAPTATPSGPAMTPPRRAPTAAATARWCRSRRSSASSSATPQGYPPSRYAAPGMADRGRSMALSAAKVLPRPGSIGGDHHARAGVPQPWPRLTT